MTKGPFHPVFLFSGSTALIYSILHRNILYFFWSMNTYGPGVHHAEERLGSRDNVELSVLSNIPFSAGFKQLIFIDLYCLLYVLSSCIKIVKYVPLWTTWLKTLWLSLFTIESRELCCIFKLTSCCIRLISCSGQSGGVLTRTAASSLECVCFGGTAMID